MTDNEFCGLLWTRARWLYPLLARLSGTFVRIGLLKEDESLKAFDVLARHGFRANLYLPGVGVDDRELKNAMNTLAAKGYLITNNDGFLVGKLAAMNPTADELVKMRRAEFKVVRGKAIK